MITSSKKVALGDTGVTLNFHTVDASIFVNTDKKTIQGNLRSFAMKGSTQAVKNSRFVIKADDLSNPEAKIQEYIDTNIEIIINGPKKN